MPVSVFPSFCVAALAAGVSTALPCEAGAAAPALACGASILLPAVPRFKAFEVFGPGDPPVPLIVFPLERVEPAAPAAPVDPAEPPVAVCAKENEQVAKYTAAKVETSFIFIAPVRCAAISRDRGNTAHPYPPSMR